MTASQTTHRLELLIMTAVACVGMFVCQQLHMFCGHLEHSSHDRMDSLALDSIWIFCLAGTAVVGLRGRFSGARVVGIVSALLIAMMAAFRTPLGIFGTLILAALALVQVGGLAAHSLRANSEEQDAGSDGASGGGSQVH